MPVYFTAYVMLTGEPTKTRFHPLSLAGRVYVCKSGDRGVPSRPFSSVSIGILVNSIDFARHCSGLNFNGVRRSPANTVRLQAETEYTPKEMLSYCGKMSHLVGWKKSGYRVVICHSSILGRLGVSLTSEQVSR